ncbi:MAG: CRISPR-associated endoribonuclease Cas6 [Candidatus Atribacteria bacterium]|nr:CRISPR-associated endoribonuclease Cas6 [Candidatus Atribacteria bacterium]
MRIKLTYQTLNQENLFLPLHYNYLIQGLIYRSLTPKLATEIHQQGFPLGQRSFKLFTFSRILNRGKIIEKNGQKFLIFGSHLSLYFSSSQNYIVEDLGERAFHQRETKLGKHSVFLSQIEVLKPPTIDKELYIRFLSPVTIYSTLRRENGEKVVHYYRPFEADFSKLMEKNARKKYFLITGKEGDSLPLSLKPHRFSTQKNHVVVFFKNTPIEGWTGIFKLEGNPDLIKTTYDAGLGNKNSAGFGMWEIWREKDD